MWTVHEITHDLEVGFIARHPTSSASPFFKTKQALANWFVQEGRADSHAEAMRWMSLR